MLATMNLSPMTDALSGIFNGNPGKQRERPDEKLEDLIQEHHPAECSMCGDVGLQEELFKCFKCQVRSQHTYCSRYYPSRRSYSGVCDWCHTGEESDSFAHGKSAITNCVTECTSMYTWRNDLEMLLAAAEVSRKASVESESAPPSVLSAPSNCKRASWSGSKRPRKPIRTKSGVGNSSIFKCKHPKLEPSSFSKRIGRRYKCILDVY